MKKILIIGAGFLQSFLIKKAKEMGYYVLAIDKNPHSIGFKYADEHQVVDIIDEEACLKYAVSMNIDGVLTAAIDYGVSSAAYIAKSMDLPGVNYKVARIVKDKFLVRRNLFNNQVDDVIQHYELSNLDELKHYSSIVFPVMVKPSDGSGSKGASRVDSIKKLKEACENAIDASLIKKCLIEDYIEGVEYGVESFVFDDKVHILGVMDKLMTSPPAYAELGHSMPSQLKNQHRIKNVVKKAIKTLGINFGPVNMDILVTKENRVCIIDVGVRMGGNLIGSHIIPRSTGIDYMGILIKSAVRDSFELSFQENENCIVTRLLALKPGRIKKLPDFKKIIERYGVEVFHQLTVGAEIKKYQDNLDGFGYIIAQSSNSQLSFKNANSALEKLDEEITRENLED